jgi:hypothetical protein
LEDDEEPGNEKQLREEKNAHKAPEEERKLKRKIIKRVARSAQGARIKRAGHGSKKERLFETLDQNCKRENEPSGGKKKRRRRAKYGSFTRRLWSTEEDNAISALVQQYGIKKWTLMAKKLQEEYHIYGRSGKQCRERY